MLDRKLKDFKYFVKADKNLDITQKIKNSDVSRVDFRPLFYFKREDTVDLPIDTLHVIQQELFAFQDRTFIPFIECPIAFNIESCKSLVLNICNDLNNDYADPMRCKNVDVMRNYKYQCDWLLYPIAYEKEFARLKYE